MNFFSLIGVIAAITQTNVQAHVTHVASSTPPPSLFALPVIARVQIDVSTDRIVVMHDVIMSRGEWPGGDVDLWVSFGPTLPRAIDAHLFAIHPNANAIDASDTGEPIAIDKSAHRPPRAYPLLGRSAMAGAVLHVREPAFRRAIAASGALGIRIRQVVEVPAKDAQNSHEIVVRLGMESGTALTLRHLVLTTREPDGFITSAFAQLCGPHADAYAIGFQSVPHAVAQTLGAIDPAGATRHTTDDLCVRYVTP